MIRAPWRRDERSIRSLSPRWHTGFVTIIASLQTSGCGARSTKIGKCIPTRGMPRSRGEGFLVARHRHAATTNRAIQQQCHRARRRNQARIRHMAGLVSFTPTIKLHELVFNMRQGIFVDWCSKGGCGNCPRYVRFLHFPRNLRLFRNLSKPQSKVATHIYKFSLPAPDIRDKRVPNRAIKPRASSIFQSVPKLLHVDHHLHSHRRYMFVCLNNIEVQTERLFDLDFHVPILLSGV